MPQKIIDNEPTTNSGRKTRMSIRCPLTMDWENETDNTFNTSSRERRALSPSAITSAAANENEMTVQGNFHPHDVLLNAGQFSDLLKGTAFYRQQLAIHRPLFRNSIDYVEEIQIVRAVLASVWEKEGRFLFLDHRSGRISLPENSMTERLVRNDLSKIPRKDARGRRRNVAKGRGLRRKVLVKTRNGKESNSMNMTQRHVHSFPQSRKDK